MARTGDIMPSHLRAALAAVFGTSVDDVEIHEQSWFARLHGRATATTRRRPTPTARATAPTSTGCAPAAKIV